MLTVFTNGWRARSTAHAPWSARRRPRRRARALELHQSLASLARRGRLLSIAIALCTICALLVAVVVVVLFLGESFNIRVSYAIDGLFIAAMLSFIGAILCFLREVFIATSTLRIGHRQG